MKNSSLSLLTILFISAISFTSCKEQGCVDNTAINYNSGADEDDGSCVYYTETSLNINFFPMAGSQNLVYNQEYIINGRKLKFTRAQFYVSAIRLKKADNTISNPEMPYSLVQALETNYSVGLIDAGTYTALDFVMGVDSAANHADPAQWGATHPLYVNSLYASYWDWSQGYVFMKLEGYVDTTAAANGTASAGFAYHIGNDEMLSAVTIALNKTIEGSNAAIELNVDYAKLLEDVNLQTELQTHSIANEPLAIKIANKTQEAITLRP